MHTSLHNTISKKLEQADQFVNKRQQTIGEGIVYTRA